MFYSRGESTVYYDLSSSTLPAFQQTSCINLVFLSCYKKPHSTNFRDRSLAVKVIGFCQITKKRKTLQPDHGRSSSQTLTRTVQLVPAVFGCHTVNPSADLLHPSAPSHNKRLRHTREGTQAMTDMIYSFLAKFHTLNNFPGYFHTLPRIKVCFLGGVQVFKKSISSLV